MIEVSSELQIVTSPQYVDGQTKEEILELERHRLARELHDSVSQQLFAAMMMMSALTEQAEKARPEMFRKQLKMVAEIINASQSEMRAASSSTSSQFRREKFKARYRAVIEGIAK